MKKGLLVVGCLLIVCCLLVLGLGGGGYIYLQNQLPSLVVKNNLSSKGFASESNTESYETESTVDMRGYIESDVFAFAYGEARVDINTVYSQVVKVNIPNDTVEITVTTNEGESTEATETTNKTYTEYLGTMIPESIFDEVVSKNQFTVKDATLNGKDYWEVTIELADSASLRAYLEESISKSFLEGIAAEGNTDITVTDPEIEYADDFSYTIKAYISKQTYLIERSKEVLSGDIIMTSSYSGETGETFESNGINPAIKYVVSSIETESVSNSYKLKESQPKDVLNVWLYSNGKF